MATVVEAPLKMVEAVAALRLPPRADQRLQILMDRNSEGKLGADEKEELKCVNLRLTGRVSSISVERRRG